MVGTISVIRWITLDGTVPLVISIVAGALIALRATLWSGGGRLRSLAKVRKPR